MGTDQPTLADQIAWLQDKLDRPRLVAGGYQHTMLAAILATLRELDAGEAGEPAHDFW